MGASSDKVKGTASKAIGKATKVALNKAAAAANKNL